MRNSWTVLSLSLVAEALGGCGGESYRLGSNTEIDPTGGGAGVTGQGGGGQGGASAGSGGVGARLAPLPDGGLAPPSNPPLIQDSTWIVSSELGVLYLATDERHLYFNESGGPIWRTDHAGISVEKLVETKSYHMSADATHVYWTTNTDIRRVPKTGGATEIIAVLSGAPTSFGWMTLDDSNVFCSTYEGGTLVRVAKTGGPFEVIATASDKMGGSAVIQNTLYWAEYSTSGAVHRFDLTTNVDEQIFPTGAAALRLAGDSLWFAMDLDFQAWRKTLFRVPLDGGPFVGYSVPGHLIPYESDGLHMYWAFTDLIRIDLATGEQQVVATEVATAHKASHIAFTRDWIFVSTRASPGGIIRLPKPAP